MYNVHQFIGHCLILLKSSEITVSKPNNKQGRPMGGGGRKRGKEVNFEFLPSPRPFPLNEKAFEALDTKPYFLDVVILVNYKIIKRDLLSIHLW